MKYNWYSPVKANWIHFFFFFLIGTNANNNSLNISSPISSKLSLFSHVLNFRFLMYNFTPGELLLALAEKIEKEKWWRGSEMFIFWWKGMHFISPINESIQKTLEKTINTKRKKPPSHTLHPILPYLNTKILKKKNSTYHHYSLIRQKIYIT